MHLYTLLSITYERKTLLILSSAFGKSKMWKNEQFKREDKWYLVVKSDIYVVVK